MYKDCVPGQRAEGQKQVIVVMKEDFLDQIDGNLEAMGYGDRSQFIRTAVLEKLATYGVHVSPGQAAPPQRTGKGGRPKKEPTVPETKKADEMEQAAPPVERQKVKRSPKKPA